MLDVTRLVDRFLGRTTRHSARGRARRRPSLELLERRQLLSGPDPIVHIDTAWLTQHGSAPYGLDQAATRYVLDTDVQADATAFVIAAPGVTLDLNGHTVTYN